MEYVKILFINFIYIYRLLYFFNLVYCLEYKWLVENELKVGGGKNLKVVKEG